MSHFGREAEMGRLAIAFVGALILLPFGSSVDGRTTPHKTQMTINAGAAKGTDFPEDSGLFSLAQAGTTWIGWIPGGAPPWSVGAPGMWDFDDRGTRAAPNDYIKNGAYSQGWTSADMITSLGGWAAEDFAEPEFVPSVNPISGNYSAWCGLTSAQTQECFDDPPGYGTYWSKWLVRSMTLSSSTPHLSYSFNSNTEPDYDYCYVIIDSENPDACGWVGPNADTLRCYEGPHATLAEDIDLSNWMSDPDACDDLPYDTDYSGDSVRVCFVVVSDGAWDDEDGMYPTIDGAMTVDDIVIDATPSQIVTGFESGTLAGWTACDRLSGGDHAAMRSTSSFVNNDPCSFERCDMAGTVLTFFDPGIAGHPVPSSGYYWNAAWSPPVDMTPYPDRGYVLSYDLYRDLPLADLILYKQHVKYVQDPNCPTGAWSAPLGVELAYYDANPSCLPEMWDFSSYVPPDADSVKVGLSVWSGCAIHGTPPACPANNESPIFDNVRLGIYEIGCPLTTLADVCNYNDAFPETDALSATATALMDIPYNHAAPGALRQGDSLVVHVAGDGIRVEFCFRIEPGPGTNLADPFFTTIFPDAGGWAACEVSDDYFVARMDSVELDGHIIPERYCTTFHELDPQFVLVGGQGVEILPDSLFTPGTKIYYAIRTSFIPSMDYCWLPIGADIENDLSSVCEVEVLPDLCKTPLACLLYVDYYNRGAQPVIENALTLLARQWDRFDYRAETAQQGNSIGNRLLGKATAPKPRYRGPVGPSLDHLAQYKVMLINNGDLPAGSNFSDGGYDPNFLADPSNDQLFLHLWLTEGPYKGLWLSGNNIASDFWACPPPSDKQLFLMDDLATDLLAASYRDLVGHPLLGESCRMLKTRHGRVVNEYSVRDSLRLEGSGCPTLYDFDVIDERAPAMGIEFVALMYDRTDLTEPHAYYASVDHIFGSTSPPYDTVRTKIDGFSLHYLRDELRPDGSCGGDLAVAHWMRDVLGGNDNRGYFYDRGLAVQYCPPNGMEDPILDATTGPVRYANALFQNYPNPFRGASGTTIRYAAARAGEAEVRVFDVAGRLVRSITDTAAPGDNYVFWDGKTRGGSDAACGVYFYQVKLEGFAGHKKMILLR
jgi:hypothetical protein